MLVKRVDVNLRNCNGPHTQCDKLLHTSHIHTHGYLSALFIVVVVHNGSNGSLGENHSLSQQERQQVFGGRVQGYSGVTCTYLEVAECCHRILYCQFIKPVMNKRTL